MGYVYMIINTVNQKKYIGISIHEPEKGRIQKHLSGQGNRIIANAVKKHGKDAFVYEILEANVFDEFLPDLEVAYIANYNTVAPNGYNLDSGGSHKIPSEETRMKQSKVKKGKRCPESTRMKLSKVKKGKKGKPHSAKTRMKLSKLNKGEKNPNFGKKRSAKTRSKISESNRGQTRSESTRRRVSEAKRHSDYKSTREFFLSLPPDMPLQGKRELLYANFPNVKKGTIQSRVRKWTVKISENNRLPEYTSAREFFLSLPPDMPLKEKRKLLYAKFSNVKRNTIWSWTYKWLAT